ncbi:MAG: HEPN domain-containing protein [Chloroflexota bacterium]|nr:HEPN domain-containing protein [Chloroflexota bacterium]MBI5702280.1 HEPN domain-containing protein [Chloroflexota bacterium]
MSEINDPRAWAEKAEEDFALAQTALKRKKPFITGACFHAQQCAEKYMKALLVSRKKGFPMTHDLLVLNDLCSQAGIFLEIEPKLLNSLTDYAVRTRYPGEGPTMEDAKEAMATARLVRKFSRSFLGL